MNELYTIGHSTHPMDNFIQLLTVHHITAVCDVRSSPYSRYNPQFNRETLQKELKGHEIAYVYLGKELGPRSDDPGCYEDGKVRYDRLARTDLFREGLRRIRLGMATYRIALMCSEKDPASCHRTILVCRHLRDKDTHIRHILEDGSLEENEITIRRVMERLKLPESDLFTSPEEMVERAYDMQGSRIAYVQEVEKPTHQSGQEANLL